MKLRAACRLPLLCCLLTVSLLLFSGKSGMTAQPSVPAASSCFIPGWPHDQSDLTPDPSLRFGILANGVRFVVQQNQEPRNRVALYLNVQAGSIHETQAQRGVAHFLEHMLFNGTTHYPPGTLVEYFQSIGMGFGGDTNAHTGFDETVYNLMLPSGESKVLAEGFKVLADYARGALLKEEEVNRERGIILAEKRSRDSAETRVSKKQMQFNFAGTLIAERDPIGVDEVLNTADSARLRSFYDQWYRPENIIVVVVGDMDPAEAERLLTRYFDPLAGNGAPGKCPEPGLVKESGLDVLFMPEPDLGYTGIALSTVANKPVAKDSLSNQTAIFEQYVAGALLNNRLRQLEEQPGSPLSKSRALSGAFLKQYEYAALNARTDAAHWRQGLALLQTALAQALQYGFTPQELQRIKKEVTALLQKQVQTAGSRDSREIAGSIIRKLNDGEVYLSPEQEMAMYLPMLQALTLKQVNGALQQLWASSRRQVEISGTAAPELAQAQPEEVIRRVFQDNAKAPVLPWEEEQAIAFPYLPVPGQPALVQERIDHGQIAATTTVYAGGVRLNCKQTDFQDNQVLLAVHFGQGRMSEPQDGMALVAEALQKESGVGPLSREQLDMALAGTNVRLDFRAGPESFTLSGSSLSSELELLIQLVYARLHDPAFSPEAFRRGKEHLQQMYEQMASSVEGMQQLEGERFLGGGGKEYGLAPWKQVQQIGLEPVKQWLRPVFAGSPLEITLVGDIDPVLVEQLVGKYFGAEQRQEDAPVLLASVQFPAGQQRLVPVTTAISKALVSVAWKTSDFWEIGRTRRLNILAAVLDDRLRVRVREELGATYSPQVVSLPSRLRPDFGLLQSNLIAAPGQAETIAALITEVAADLGTRGVTEEELHRALEPTLTSIRDYKRSNKYWLEAVLSLSSRHPAQLTWPASISEDFAAIKADELTSLARQYLTKEAAATLVVSPEQQAR